MNALEYGPQEDQENSCMQNEQRKGSFLEHGSINTSDQEMKVKLGYRITEITSRVQTMRQRVPSSHSLPNWSFCSAKTHKVHARDYSD